MDMEFLIFTNLLVHLEENIIMDKQN